MEEIPNNSVNLMVTSPPYNVTKQYDENLTLHRYLELIHDALKEVMRVLQPSGIIALNVANVGRKPYIPLDCFFIEILEDLGIRVVQEIIWDKAASAGGSCAWGSWQSASNPSLRDVHEYIIIAQKPPLVSDPIQLNPTRVSRFPEILDDRPHSIKKDELFSNLWGFGTESANRVSHPAPFRVELPYRLIQLYTKENDIILDPFMGSGSTALAAIIANRRYIGYELNQDYISIANRRIDEYFHPEKKEKRLKEEKQQKRAIKKQKKIQLQQEQLKKTSKKGDTI